MLRVLFEDALIIGVIWLVGDLAFRQLGWWVVGVDDTFATIVEGLTMDIINIQHALYPLSVQSLSQTRRPKLLHIYLTHVLLKHERQTCRFSSSSNRQLEPFSHIFVPPSSHNATILILHPRPFQSYGCP